MLRCAPPRPTQIVLSSSHCATVIRTLNGEARFTSFRTSWSAEYALFSDSIKIIGTLTPSEFREIAKSTLNSSLPVSNSEPPLNSVAEKFFR
jgi:hypothetical protein